jgi:hypothetical protein
MVNGPLAGLMVETASVIVSGSSPAVFDAMTLPFLSSTKEPYCRAEGDHESCMTMLNFVGSYPGAALKIEGSSVTV